MCQGKNKEAPTVVPQITSRVEILCWKGEKEDQEVSCPLPDDS